jgi:hypothetical protein
MQYLTKFDVVLVVALEHTIREMARFIVEAKKMDKRPVLLAVICVPFNHVREVLKNPETFKDFKVFLDNCDAFLNYNHVGVSEYLKLYTDTPIINFPLCYPFEFTKSFFEKRERKKKIIHVSGHALRTDDVASMLIAKKIQQIHPDFIIEVVERKGLNIEPLRDSNYRIIPFMEWKEYIKHLRKTYIVIDMDNTWTVGRVPNDAAAVGTPCIGLNSGSQADLFPDLTCSDIVDTKKAIKLGIKLIEDKNFYEKIQRNAFRRLKKYSYKTAEKRMRKLLNEISKL